MIKLAFYLAAHKLTIPIVVTCFKTSRWAISNWIAGPIP